jgi:hypothetical protein
VRGTGYELGGAAERTLLCFAEASRKRGRFRVSKCGRITPTFGAGSARFSAGEERGTGYELRVYHEGKCNASFMGTGFIFIFM